MPEKAKIFLIYLFLGAAPMWIYAFPVLSAGISSNKSVVNFLVYVPYAALTLLGLLGWQLNQTRVLWSCLLTLAVYHLTLTPKPLLLPGSHPGHWAEVVSVSLPLAFTLLFSMKESKLWSDATGFRLFLSLLPFLFFSGFSRWDSAGLDKVFFWGLGGAGKPYQLPPLAGLSACVLAFRAFTAKDQKTNVFLLALTAILAPVFFSLHASFAPHSGSPAVSPPLHVILAFTAVTVVLLHAVFRMYWKRVYSDALTGIPNRQSLDERWHTLKSRYAVAMVDIDHFKKFNDTYGHHEGDNVLRMVAKHLKDHFGDNAYRYGGEEFCVVFEGSSLREAEPLADGARRELAVKEFVLRSHLRRRSEEGKKMRPVGTTVGEERKVRLTISVGLAATQDPLESYEQVLKRADNALYRAKDAGRNCVVT